MERRRAPNGYRTSGPVMREQDFMQAPNYGRLHGDNIRIGPSTESGSDMRRNPDMNEENRSGTYMDDLRAGRTKRNMKKGGAVTRGDGCCMKGKTKGRVV